MSNRFEDVAGASCPCFRNHRQDADATASRRQLFTGVLRCASLALLCVGAASLLAKRYRLMREGICINDGLCKGCELFETCCLPRASSAKKALKE